MGPKAMFFLAVLVRNRLSILVSNKVWFWDCRLELVMFFFLEKELISSLSIRLNKSQCKGFRKRAAHPQPIVFLGVPRFQVSPVQCGSDLSSHSAEFYWKSANLIGSLVVFSSRIGNDRSCTALENEYYS